MKFLDKRLARCAFVNYIFANRFCPTTSIEIKEAMDIIRYDDTLLRNLTNFYDKNSEKMESEILDSIFDLFLKSIIIAGMCEINLNSEYKLVISEYTKIALVYDAKFNLVNGILQEYVKKLRREDISLTNNEMLSDDITPVLSEDIISEDLGEGYKLQKDLTSMTL